MVQKIRKKVTPKNPKTPVMTNEEIEEKSDRVMHPETDTVEVCFLGQNIKMRPLPISFSKQVGRLCRPIIQKFSEQAQAVEKADSVDAATLNAVSDSDEEAVDALLATSKVILGFYDLEEHFPVMEEHATVDSLYSFVSAQIGLNKANDFLLRSCRALLKYVEAQVLEEKKAWSLLEAE